MLLIIIRWWCVGIDMGCQCRHVHATEKTLDSRGRGPGDVILGEAKAMGADLLVKGAYTQSRLRQMIFGGATSSVLAKAEVKKAGYDEAIMLDTEGYVSEASGENIFIVRKGLNVTGREDYVGEIKRYIQMVNERMRCVITTLPYMLSSRLTIELVKYMVFWLNAFSVKNGVSTIMSPR